LIGLLSRFVVVIAAASILTTLIARLALDKSEADQAVELLGAQTQAHAATIAATPPAERRDVARELGATIGLGVALEEAEVGDTPRAQWRAGRVYVLARVPDSHGQIVIGPLPAQQITGLPLVVLLAIGVAFGVSLLAARPVLRRIRSFESIAAQMCSGDFAARTQCEEGDPLDGLGASLNQLADRIGQLLTDERDLLRTVAHEVRAPIARMRFRVDKIHRRSTEAEHKDSAGLVGDLTQVDNLFEELLTYVAFDEFDQDRPKLQTTVVPVVSAVQRVIDEVTSTNALVRVELEGPASAQVVANQKLFDRAITNLLLNAIAYGGPDIRIAVRVFEHECVVDVQDSGPGVPELDRPKVLKPFVRLSQKKTRGTGLGLPIVSRIMRLHGGRLHILDAPTGGASIQLAWLKEPPRAHFERE